MNNVEYQLQPIGKGFPGHEFFQGKDASFTSFSPRAVQSLNTVHQESINGSNVVIRIITEDALTSTDDQDKFCSSGYACCTPTMSRVSRDDRVVEYEEVTKGETDANAIVATSLGTTKTSS